MNDIKHHRNYDKNQSQRYFEVIEGGMNDDMVTLAPIWAPRLPNTPEIGRPKTMVEAETEAQREGISVEQRQMASRPGMGEYSACSPTAHP